jgi:hypothetical protein
LETIAIRTHRVEVVGFQRAAKKVAQTTQNSSFAILTSD